MSALRHFHEIDLHEGNPYGFTASFNPTIAAADGRPCGWVSPDHVGINQGPITLMIENYRSGFLWRLMRCVPAIIAGLHRAGFSGGCL
ncbi:glucoamylase family protein [Mesorhizobium sp. M1233]|uniref:glucoamylase family protein n=1 Tax=Mesorhizobium sp. M1233 TaxID=2957072 RepID=UPI0033352C85